MRDAAERASGAVSSALGASQPEVVSSSPMFMAIPASVNTGTAREGGKGIASSVQSGTLSASSQASAGAVAGSVRRSLLTVRRTHSERREAARG